MSDDRDPPAQLTGRTISPWTPFLRRSASAARQLEKPLVVDDEEGVRRLFQRLLTDAGYNVRLAHDGAMRSGPRRSFTGRGPA
jgi:hypothetical protein